jgi:predicted RNA-binding Zn ribbon-like protein
VTLSIATLPLVGGHPALDRVNTVTPRVPVRGEVPHDHLVDAAALLTWGVRAGLIDPGEEAGTAAALGPADLGACREIRDALHAVLLAALGEIPADRPEVAVALDVLQVRGVAAASRARLTVEPGAVRSQAGPAPSARLADRVAEAALRLALGADLGRLRRCPPGEGGCGWLFLDQSRNRSRRWCRMADCGTEVKSRRLTQRRRAARGDYP